MILSLGFRGDVFAKLNPLFLGIALIPATGTVIGSSYLLFHWLLNRMGSDKISKRAMVAGMMMTHFIVLLIGFYIGRSMPKYTITHLDKLVKATAIKGTNKLSEDIYNGQSVIATFLGEDHPSLHPTEVAAAASASVYDILMHLNPGLPRYLVNV